MARMYCQMFSTGFNSGARDGRNGRDVLGDFELGRCVPSGTVHEQHSVCSPFDMAADFVDVKLHGVGVGEGQRECGTLASRRTDGTEQICAFVALVGRLAGPGSPTRPLPYDTVLLADARFILEPYLDRLVLRQIGEMGAQRARKVFLYASTISPS